MILLTLFPLISFFSPSHAAVVKVHNTIKAPVQTVMVTETTDPLTVLNTSDDGYPAPGKPFIVNPEITRFTNDKGLVTFKERDKKVKYRLRKFGHKDLELKDQSKKISATLESENDLFILAAAKPANIWLGALDVGSKEDKIIFKMQCGFCHQQGSEMIRLNRSPEEWSKIIKRMVRYGSRLPSDLQEKLPELLSKNYLKLNQDPSLLAEFRHYSKDLQNVTISEWPVGDSMSQTHDVLVSAKGLVYVADNIQDRLYELNPKTNEITVYKIPHLEGDEPGGLISARLKEFPKHDSTSNAHSLAESKVDGHIFITPSAQQRLVEFDPDKKEFILHQMDQGFYPHTIRVDHKDNVWFTLALSNQVAKFDRKKKEFTYFDLPARSIKEKIITKNIHLIFKLMSWGIPLSNWLKIDRESNGVPLAYGIDITPDGKVWFARLHAKDIGVINPDDGSIKLIPTPFWGPRRLRTDADGNLWVVSFGESKLAKYDTVRKVFRLYDLPVYPLGSETPYSLNVDKKRHRVWVTGNQSDSVFVLDIKTEKWTSIPLPRRTTFTRDFEFSEDGAAWTANSNFPSWQIEDTQPTLISISKN
jgi:streptogramin lyase